METGGKWLRWSMMAVLLAMGCGVALQEPDTGISAAGDLEVVSGSGQTGVPGERLPRPIRVRVVDAEGHGIEGARVAWIPVEKAGVARPSTSLSNGSGVAETVWILGPETGPQALEAQFVGEVVRFEANAVKP